MFLLLRKCGKVTNQQLTKITKTNRKIWKYAQFINILLSYITQHETKTQNPNCYIMLWGLDPIISLWMNHTHMRLLSRSNSSDYNTNIIYIMYKYKKMQIHTKICIKFIDILSVQSHGIFILSRSNKSVQL